MTILLETCQLVCLSVPRPVSYPSFGSSTRTYPYSSSAQIAHISAVALCTLCWLTLLDFRTRQALLTLTRTSSLTRCPHFLLYLSATSTENAELTTAAPNYLRTPNTLPVLALQWMPFGNLMELRCPIDHTSYPLSSWKTTLDTTYSEV